jgi:signal transduction histidine kinase
MFFQETRQNLDADIAAHIAAENDCFMGDTANIESLKNVFHNIMIINPSIEVYLLDREGKILTYYAPNQEIQIDYVPLEPIKQFLANDDVEFIIGTDPKNPKKHKTFSAAEVYDDGLFKGYMYVILGSQEFDNVSKMVFGSYILKLVIRSMIITLIMAIIIGLVSIGVIIRNVRKIGRVLREFKGGNLNARIHLRGKTELSEFADSFNEMAETIVYNIDELKRMDHLRRDLAANVSHDLRTPLTIIRGYAETVQMKGQNLSIPERNQFMDIIIRSIDRLLTLVSELFALSKLEAKETVPEKEVFSIGELLQDIHQKNLVIAKAKDIEFTLSVVEDPLLIQADISMMEKVFQNLLDNAFRYTPANGKVSTTMKRKNEDNVVILIEDSGTGIDIEDINRIFQRYQRNKNDNSRKSNGSGLGLSIVKKIVDLHGFNITVESESLKGTTFIITIPVYSSHNQQ